MDTNGHPNRDDAGSGMPGATDAAGASSPAAELLLAERRVALGILRDLVERLGYEGRVIERAAGVPYDTLLVNLPPTAAGEIPYQLALTFYPTSDDELGATNLLQYYIPLPIAPTAETRPAVLELTAEINNQLVLGHVGLTADRDQLHFRYVQPLAADRAPSTGDIDSVLLLVAYSLRLFEAALRAVADGSRTLDAARHMIRKAYG